MYAYLMSYEARSFTSTVALFYAIGAALALSAYALNSIEDFAVVMGVWTKGTIVLALETAGYWLYYNFHSSVGYQPNAAFRNVNKCFVVSVAVLLALMFVSKKPETDCGNSILPRSLPAMPIHCQSSPEFIDSVSGQRRSSPRL